MKKIKTILGFIFVFISIWLMISNPSGIVNIHRDLYLGFITAFLGVYLIVFNSRQVNRFVQALLYD